MRVRIRVRARPARLLASAAQPPFRAAVVCGFGATALGAAAAMEPEAAAIVVGFGVFVVLAGLPPHWSVAAAVAAAVFSRLLTVGGWVPATFNFAHFPLAAAAALAALRVRRVGPAAAKGLGRGLAALAALCVVSGLINGVEAQRPALAWLLWSEPLLLVFALTRAGLSEAARRGLWALLLCCAWLQLPFGLWQAAELGLGDHVQGTFVSLGAGSHVAGAMALLGALTLVGAAVHAGRIEARYLRLGGAALLLVLPILSDAKASVVFFVPALVWTLCRASGMSWRRLAAPALAGSALLAAVFALYPPLQLIMHWETMEAGLAAKQRGIAALLNYAIDAPLGGAVGLGPGQSVSRVGVLSVEGETTVDSPISRLGLRPAPAAERLLLANRRDPIASASSVWSYISSWSGLAGDLGPAGIALYASMWLGLLAALARRRDSGADAAGGAIVMALLLGGAFEWLEEPGFVLPAALMVGAGLAPLRGPRGSASADGKIEARGGDMSASAEKRTLVRTPISTVSYEQAIERCREWIEQVSPDRPARAVFVVSAHAVVEAYRNPEYAAMLAAADLALPDGMPLVWALRSLGAKGQQRVYGPELMLRLCRQAAERRHSVYLYGGRPERLAELEDRLCAHFPALRVVGAESPPFRALSEQEDGVAVARIRASGARLIFVGLGAPKQERWIIEHRDCLPGAVLAAVGAAFDLHSGRIEQAPPWMQRNGLEWLFRLLCEPRRLWRRYLLETPWFLPLWAAQKVGLLAAEDKGRG